MKKNIFKLTALFFAAICLTNCHKYNETVFLCDCGKVEIEKKEYIAMCVLPRDVTINSENYLRIENHTRNILGYGSHFYMNYFNQDKWEPIDFDFYFTDIGLGTQAGETTVDLMDLYSLAEEYNNACEGKYRIGKEFYIRSAGQSCRYNITAEFELTRHEPLGVSLTSTKWKLVRFVDAVTGEVKRAEPRASMYNFLIFNEEQTISGFSSNKLQGNYEIDYATCYINIDIHAITELNEGGDGELFIELLNKVDIFSLQGHELRLYYNNKQNYMLLKPRKL